MTIENYCEIIILDDKTIELPLYSQLIKNVSKKRGTLFYLKKEFYRSK